jgi:hypothetical protein
MSKSIDGMANLAGDTKINALIAKNIAREFGNDYVTATAVAPGVTCA